MELDRQTGRTTQQMKDAPHGALFIWCTGDTRYPKALARLLGRDDLQIVPLSFLSGPSGLGRTFTGLVLDHAAPLVGMPEPAYEMLQLLRTRLRVSNATVDEAERR